MLTFLRVLAGTRSPAYSVADHEDDSAGDQRGEQHHQAGHARALQHVSRTRRVLHLRPRARPFNSAGTCREPHALTYNERAHTLAHAVITRSTCARARTCVAVALDWGKARKSPLGYEGHHATRRPAATAKPTKSPRGCAYVCVLLSRIRQSSRTCSVSAHPARKRKLCVPKDHVT